MKRFLALLTAITATTLLLVADIIPTKFYLWQGGQATAYDIDDDELTYGDGTLTIKGTTYQLADIDSITFTAPAEEADTTTVASDTVYVTFNGTSATVSPTVSGISATISGADVNLTNSNTDREMCFVLSGNSPSGSFVYNGTLKTTIRLNGLTLTGSTAEAINVKCGKRIALELADGTTNTLADASTDGGQKAAFYTKGHLEVSGSGTLSLTGNIKHGLSSKEYMLIKRTAGTLKVLSAANDGIHAGQYFQMNGGTLTLTNIKGDGIQAEATGEVGDEDDGQLIIKGGTLNLTLTGQDAAALKSDSLMTITDGNITIQSTGAAVKGLKSKTDLNISGGTFVIKQSGDYIVENGEPSYTTAMKANGDLTITGGTFNINNSAVAGRGLSADGDITISEDAATTQLTITGTGKGEALDTSKTVESDDTGNDDTTTSSYRVYVSVPTTQGGGGPGGNNSVWKNVYLYTSSGTQVAQLTSTITATVGNSSRTFYYYDFKQSDSGTYYFKSDNYTSGGGWGGGTTYTIRSSNFTGPTSGSSYFYTMSSSYTTSGTTRTYTLTNATSTWANATLSAGGTTGSGDYLSAKAISGDKNVNLLAGTITLTMSGAAGKGIKADGNFTMGRADQTGPTLNVTTTGSKLGSSSGGGFGPGQQSGNSSSAKAIKAQGTAYVLGGELTVSTATDGAEGLESKTAIYIEGGQHYFKCYDDCINSAGVIVFNGGVTVCYSNGNDAVDSNYGRTGAITIGNGTIFAFTSKGSPEEGLDCDNNSYIQITGTGIAISAGGAQGGGSSSSTISGAKQGYAFVTSSVSYQTGRYYTLADASGNNLVTYSFPASVSSSLSLFTATGMVKGSSYTIKYSTTAPTDATTAFHGLYLGSTHKGTTSVTSFTAK